MDPVVAEMEFLINKKILIASTQPWFSPLLSKQFIALELSKYCNEIVFASLYRIFKDRSYFKQFENFQFHDIKPQNVTLKVFKLPPGYLKFKVLCTLAKRIFSTSFDSNYQPDVIISFSPVFYLLNDLFPATLRIYYCADHLGNNETMRLAEKKILHNSDMVIAASKQLYDDLRSSHPNVHYLPHGVNILSDNHDERLREQVAEWFNCTPHKPIFGFVGYVSESLDFDLICYIAQQNPGAIIALVGHHADGVKKKIANLPSNVICPGPIPTEGLKYCLQHFDVGIVPYVNSRYILRTNPTKILQYISCGLPVVTTEVGEDFSQNKFVYVAKSHMEFNKLIQVAMANDSSELFEERVRYGQENSWDARVKFMDRLVDSCSDKYKS